MNTSVLGQGFEEVLDRFVEGLFAMVMDHHRKQVAETDLTMAQAQALRLLRDEPVATSRLARLLGISPPAVTQLTDRLVGKKLIERRSGTEDRRSVTVQLSERGVRLMDDLRLQRNVIFGEMLSRISIEDRSLVIEALAKLAQAFEPAGALERYERPAVVGRPARRRSARTPKRAPGASKTIEEIQTAQPVPKRRMRIEWD